MFKDLLRKYLKIKGLSKTDVSLIIGDTPQAVSDFMSKEGNPRNKTKDKYFKITGFKDFYFKNINLTIEGNEVEKTDLDPETKINSNSEKELSDLAVLARDNFEELLKYDVFEEKLRVYCFNRTKESVDEDDVVDWKKLMT